jgi:hypothetical protein
MRSRIRIRLCEPGSRSTLWSTTIEKNLIKLYESYYMKLRRNEIFSFVFREICKKITNVHKKHSMNIKIMKIIKFYLT